VIQMAAAAPHKPNLMSWLLFGTGRAPGESHARDAKSDAPKKAVKCDMCKDLSGGPACVRACPTGAAIRISPEKFVEVVASSGRGG
jgi:cGMP-dependent protein kinase 2